MKFTNSLSVFFISIAFLSVLLSGVLPGYLYVLGFLSLIFLIYIRSRYNWKGVLYLTIISFFSIVSVVSTQSYTPILYLIFSVLAYTSLNSNNLILFSENNARVLFMFVVFFFITQYLFFPATYDGRFRGIYSDPNFVSLWFLSTTFFFYSLSLKSNRSGAFIFQILIIFFGIIVAVVTQSRMALLALLFFVSAQYFSRIHRLRTLRLVVLIILLSSILGQYFLYFAFTNFLEVGNTVNENLVDRLYNLNDTSNMARVSAAFYGLNYFFNGFIDFINIFCTSANNLSTCKKKYCSLWLFNLHCKSFKIVRAVFEFRYGFC